MKKFNSYEFLENISYERISGSEEERKCAEYILENCKNYGVEAEIEEFNLPSSIMTSANLVVGGVSYDVTGVLNSGSTSPEGITSDLIYIENGSDTNLLDIENKIVMMNQLTYDLYKKLADKKVKGMVLLSGTVYDDFDNTDLEVRALRERHYINGEIPGVCIRIKDAYEILTKSNMQATLTITQVKSEVTSQNVVATIKGKTDDVIVFTAHYDSVRFSTGAYDNATGSVTIFDLMQRYAETTPEKTLKFVWCGSEEVGLKGAHAYAEKHSEELSKYQLCINIDMTGVPLGRDIAVCTSEDRLVSYLSYYSQIKGFALETRQGVYSSDSTAFADKSVPSVSFARISSPGGAAIHSRKDVINFITKECMDKTTDFIKEFADTLLNAKCFPVKREMPDNMKKELDKYLGRNK